MSAKLGIYQAPDLDVLVGNFAYTNLKTGVSHRLVAATVEGDLVIGTNPASAIRNGGSIFAAFSDAGIDEAGTKTHLGDPRLMMLVTDFLSQQHLTRTRLASTAVGTTHLVETMIVPFEWLHRAIDPAETRYLEREPTKLLRFFLKAIANGGNIDASRIAKAGGGGTVALNNVTVRVQQIYADGSFKLPLYKPGVEMQVIPVNGTNARHEVLLNLTDVCRGLTLLQDDTTDGQVADIINNFALRSDRRWLIGDGGLVDWADFCRFQEFNSPGNVFATPDGAGIHIDFMQDGQLSNCLNPKDDVNLRFVFDDQVSATGTGSSQILVLRHLLTRDLYVGPDGRRVVTASVEIPV